MAEAAKTAKEADAAPVAEKKGGKEGGKTIDENEIRVTAQGKMRNYVTYAASLFTDKKQTSVVLMGMGRVINKTVSLAEILKRRVKGLYQLTEIGSVEVTDTTPAETEDQEPTETTRLLSVISILLTTQPTDDPRYQPPLPDDQVEPLKKVPARRMGRGGGTARGRHRIATGRVKGGPQAAVEGETAAPGGPRGRGRGGRGRGRGGRGRGRGGGRGRGRKGETGGETGAQAPQTEAAAV